MFQFRGFPSYTYVFSIWWRSSIPPGFPIRTSAGLWIFAPNRSFSQLVTSFIGSWCQVILPTLLLAWPLLKTNSLNFYLSLRSFGSSNYIRIRDLLVLSLKLKFPFRKNLSFTFSTCLGFDIYFSYMSLVFFSLSSFSIVQFSRCIFEFLILFILCV